MWNPFDLFKKKGKSDSKPPKKPKATYLLIKAIREEKDYKSNIKRRDKNARKFVDENYKQRNANAAVPGQLIMFDYFEPKTKEQLQYYDAMPCTIFFGIVKSKDGPRVLGFNIHYYPPKIRFILMDRIFDIFKPLYLNSWNKPLTAEMDDFNYKMLIRQLLKAKLEFGIREYIPSLMANVTPIPPNGWSKAVFTEGRFKKETRQQILSYWKNKSMSVDKPAPKRKK